MFRLAHISDIHLSPLPMVRRRDLLSKRATGYANWMLNRKKSHGGNALDLLVADLKSHKPDHIAVTGDLVNLALGAEIGIARQWLEALGERDHISVVPGNHDAYVRGALAKACHEWEGYIPKPTHGRLIASVDEQFPYVRCIQNVALIGVSSAVATAPFLSAGRFREDQAARLKALLDQTRHDGLFRIIMIHHPPFRYDGDVAKRLFGIRLFQRIVHESGAELVLHGHTHLDSFQRIAGRGKEVPVIGVPSAAQAPEGHKPAARWNGFEISGEPGSWDCLWTERGVQTDGSVTEIASRRLWERGDLAISAKIS